jgi:hypothetical protein
MLQPYILLGPPTISMNVTLLSEKIIIRHTIVIWTFHLSIIEQFELVIGEQLDIIFVIQTEGKPCLGPRHSSSG